MITNPPPLVLNATLDALAPIREYLTRAAQNAALPAAATYQLLLAVDEIATNTILYGYADKTNGLLHVNVICDTAQFSVILEDNGIPFNPCAHELPTANELDASASERQLGGLGIFLARQGVDRLEYQRDGNVNRTRFIINRT